MIEIIFYAIHNYAMFLDSANNNVFQENGISVTLKKLKPDFGYIVAIQRKSGTYNLLLHYKGSFIEVSSFGVNSHFSVFV